MLSKRRSTLHVQRFGSLWKANTIEKKKERPKKVEIRCIKYSPCVQPVKFPPLIEGHEYEARMWRNAFEEMGRLHALRLDDLKTFTILNKEPYHCSSITREFKACHGALANVGHHLTKQTDRAFYRKETVFPCVAKVNLPRAWTASGPDEDLIDLILAKKKGETEKAFIPPSSIIILWGPRAIGDAGMHFERLVKQYGHILFTIWESPRRQIVVFDNIKTCYEIVNAAIPPSLMNISWCDKRFYNFGHFAMFKNYELSKDETWKKGIEAMKEKGFDTTELYGW